MAEKAKKLNPELAAKEVESWIEKVDPRGRKDPETMGPIIQDLIKAFVDGDLRTADDGGLIYKLVRPFGEEVKIDELTFPTRLIVKKTEDSSVGIDSTSSHQLIMAKISALTGQKRAVLSHMDDYDLPIPRAIATFFL